MVTPTRRAHPGATHRERRNTMVGAGRTGGPDAGAGVLTSFEPMSPVLPITTIFNGESFRLSVCQAVRA
jgi:hypothetical protein